jgi:hypothetical protein
VNEKGSLYDVERFRHTRTVHLAITAVPYHTTGCSRKQDGSGLLQEIELWELSTHTNSGLEVVGGDAQVGERQNARSTRHNHVVLHLDQL